MINHELSYALKEKLNQDASLMEMIGREINTAVNEALDDVALGLGDILNQCSNDKNLRSSVEAAVRKLKERETNPHELSATLFAK